jgi:hypothetical protein
MYRIGRFLGSRSRIGGRHTTPPPVSTLAGEAASMASWLGRMPPVGTQSHCDGGEAKVRLDVFN